MDVINAIALTANTDAVHRIHVFRDGILQTLSLAELDRQATSVAEHLRRYGIAPGDRVGIIATNSIEWVLVDLATLKLGGVVAGLEAGRVEPATALDKYGLKIVFVDGAGGGDSRIMPLHGVREWAEHGLGHLAPFHGGYEPRDICAIKFTSGSTGVPKGLEATVGSVNDSLSSVQEMFRHGAADNILVFCRLALLQQRYWIYSALVNGHDVTITTVDDTLRAAQAVHPTVIMGVPGFFDDVKRRLEALGDGRARYSAIQSILGGSIHYLWTGSAPASRSTLEFYNHAGVPLYQGYGLTETCIVAKNGPDSHRIGSVGKVLPNKTVRFDEQGILIVGSRNPVNTRYTWCGPGDNEKMFLPTGEVRTHDLGYLDDDGYLYILGRVDDIIVLSSGRNVLVRPIEERLKDQPGVQECVLYGTGRPFLTALVSGTPGAIDREAIEVFLSTLNTTVLPEQQIRGLVVADEPFTVANGLLTSQFKPVRNEIYRRLARQIEAIYER